MSVRGGETAALLFLAGVKRRADGSQTLDLMCRARWQKSSTATHKSLLSASWRGFHVKRVTRADSTPPVRPMTYLSVCSHVALVPFQLPEKKKKSISRERINLLQLCRHQSCGLTNLPAERIVPHPRKDESPHVTGCAAGKRCLKAKYRFLWTGSPSCAPTAWQLGNWH